MTHLDGYRRPINYLRISVTEQVPAAIWGERGLLNTRGELFVSNARHIPAELPRLSGPESRSADVAQRYLDVRERQIPVGLDLRRVHLDIDAGDSPFCRHIRGSRPTLGAVHHQCGELKGIHAKTPRLLDDRVGVFVESGRRHLRAGLF